MQVSRPKGKFCAYELVDWLDAAVLIHVPEPANATGAAP